MRSFDEAMQLTRGVSIDLILSEEECAGFWETMGQIPTGGTALEIGCYRGRSSSLMLQAAQDNCFLSIHCDPWTTGEAHEWMTMAQKIPVPFVVLKMKSEEALALPWLANVPLDLVYIDGDHETPAVEIDVKWGERIKVGGILCAHDFGRDFLSGVEITLRNYVSDPRWQPIGVWGNFRGVEASVNLAYLATCFFGSTDDIWMLRDSAARFGVDLKYYGVGQAFLPGFIDIKVTAMLPELQALLEQGYTHVLYTDGPDTFFIKGPKEIEAAYEALGRPPWLISAETSCYPHTHLGQSLPLDKRCPNTGQYMGEIETIMKGWEKLKSLYDDGTDNEQGWVIRGIVDGELPGVMIDMGRYIFRSEADNYFPGMSGCVLHFNGGYWDPTEGKRQRMLPVWERVNA